MQKRRNSIDYIFPIVMFGLMALLYKVCVNGYPLWAVSAVLAANIIFLVVMILFAPFDGEDFSMRQSQKYKKNHRKLLLWGIPAGIFLVAMILISIFYETVWPLVVLYIIAAILQPYREKKF